MRRFGACGLLFLLGSATGAAAASDPPDVSPRDTVYSLPTLEVRETRPERSRELRSLTGAASVLRVEDAPSRWTTTADLLSAALGVHVRRFGGLGAYSAVSVRGSNASQVVFYLDGVPLSQAQYGVINAADLPLAALERVEVYRSGSPTVFSDAGGGVIQLVSRGAERSEAQILASAASFDTRRVRMWGSRLGERAAGFASYDFQTSQGAYSFFDDNATQFNTADDTVTARVNNDFAQHAATVRTDLALGGTPGVSTGRPFGAAGRLTLGLDMLRKEAGVPGLASYQAEHARFETTRGLGSLTWESPSWWRHTLDLRTQLYGVGTRDRFTDRENELGSGRQDFRGETFSYGLRQEAWLARGPLASQLGLVAEGKREGYRPTNLLRGETEGPVSRRETIALGAEERLEPAADRLRLVADVRREIAHDEFPQGPAYPGGLTRPAVDTTLGLTRLHAGVVAVLPLGFEARANASRSGRLPTLFELYGNRGTVVGNRGLVPERLASQDLGVAWQGLVGGVAAAQISVSGYRTDAEALILFIQNSQQTSVAQNISAALLQGIETQLDLRGGPWRGFAAWTYQDTRDRSAAPHWNGRQLPGRPPHEVDTRLEWRTSELRAFHEYQFVSENYLDRANRQPVPSRHLHNLGAGVVLWHGRLEITLEVRNVTDRRVLDVAAYPLPGRAFGVALESRL